MSSDEKDAPLGDLLGDEIGEWDAMFDSLHEGGEGKDEGGAGPAGEASSAAPSADAPTTALSPGASPPVDTDSQGEFDIDSTMGAPFEGAPESGASVDALAPGGGGSSPFSTNEEDFSELMGGEPEALGGLLGSGPVDSSGITASSALRPPTALDVRAGQESLARACPRGPEDVALDDFGSETTGTMPPESITRMSKSAEAFFEDDAEAGGEVSLELDDDFYDGIQISGGDDASSDAAPPLNVDAALLATEADEKREEAEAAAPEKRTFARVVRRDSQDESSAFDEDTGTFSSEALAATMGEEDPFLSAIPLPSESYETSEQAAARASELELEIDDRRDLGIAVDDALEGLASERSTRPAALPSGIRPARADQVPEFERSAELEGVVEAAIEDAVAMSTGTLLTGPRLEEPDVEPDLPPEKFGRVVPGPDLGAIDVPSDVGMESEGRTEEYAQLLVLYERELALLDAVEPTIRLRIEAGRIAETLGDLEQARVHFDEALKFDPHLVPANRALRRIERVLGNWEEVINLLDKELAKASPAERDALAQYRIGLLMAVGEMDLARVAVGELLDATPTDARALLANLDLAVIDGREEEIESTLDSLSEVLTEPALMAAALSLGAALAERGGRLEKAMTLYGRANELQPSLGTSMGQRAAALQGKSSEVALQALEQARIRSHSRLRAGLDWQRGEMHLRRSENEEAREVFQEALIAYPDDVLLRQMLVRACAGDRELTVQAVQGLESTVSHAGWSSQLLVRAARLSTGADAKALLLRAAEEEPGSRLVAAELRKARIDAGDWAETYEGDSSALAVANSTPLPVYRKAQSALRAGRDSEALAAVSAYRTTQATGSIPLEVAVLDLAYQLNDKERLSQYQVPSSTGNAADLERALRTRSRALTRLATANLADTSWLVRASQSWGELAEVQGEGHDAAGIALQVASMSKNAGTMAPHVAAAEAHASSPTRAMQIAIEGAGRGLGESPEASAEVIHGLQVNNPDRRGALLQWTVSLSSGDRTGAATCLEAEAERLASEDSASADRCLYRAAFLRLQYELEPSLAAASLELVSARRPEFSAAAELLKSAATRGGQAPGAAEAGVLRGSPSPVVEQDNLSSELRRAETLARTGEQAAAADLLVTLRAQNPDDALVAYGFDRACWEAGASAQLAEHGLAALRIAEEREDAVAKARACEELARVDGELRGDYSSALMFWESASLADPSRADLLRTLERELGNQGGERLDGETMWKALGRTIEALDAGRERCSYLLERARLGKSLGRPEAEVVADYQQAYEDERQCRHALFHLETRASQQGASEELADLENKVADYFAADPRARAAFLVRSGETMRSLGQKELALERFRTAAETMPGFAPALFAWRDTALDHEMWDSLAEACLLEATSVDTDRGRADLYHLAGVTLMDKASENEQAIDALRKVLVVDAGHRDAFVRLRQLFVEGERPDDLAQLLSMRLEVETDEGALCEVRHALADVLHVSLGNPSEAMTHLRAVLAMRPGDKKAIVGVSEMAWELELWAEAAEALMARAPVEVDNAQLIEVFSKLGTIYTEHLPEASWALKSFRKVISLDPTNKGALENLAILATESGDHKLALGACEQLIKQDPPIAEKIAHLHRMAKVFAEGLGDTNKAERALRVALDLDLASEPAFDALIAFYKSKDNMRSARVNMDRVANAMRVRIRKDPGDITAYRVIARSMDARCKVGVGESRVIARSAAGVAVLLGDTSPAMKALAAGTKSPGRAKGLARQEHDDLLFPASAQGGVRALLAMLGDRLAKHVGIDVRSHGVGRSDRLRKGAAPLGVSVLELAAEMGLDDADVYLSTQRPLVLAAEPTRPASLIFGKDLASSERPEELRFLAGREIKLVSAHLAVPLQLGLEKFGVLLVGVLRQFQPEFAPLGVDEAAASAEQQRLRRLIPSGMLQELGPFALGLAASDFDHKAIWQALMEAGNRAGLLCAGDTSAAIRALMRQKEIADPKSAMQDAEIASLVRFACSEEHASLYLALD